MDSLIDNEMDLDPYLLFVNVIRSQLTRQKYFGRLNAFFDFISIPGSSLGDRCRLFITKCNENPKYPLNCVYRFVIYLREKNGQRGDRCFSDLQLSKANKTSLRYN